MIDTKTLLNSGEKVHRPRYTLDLPIILILWMVYNYRASFFEEDIRWYGLEAHIQIPFSTLMHILTLLKYFDVELHFFEVDYHFLKQRANTVYNEFLKNSDLVWERTAHMLPNSGCVLHPVDLFLKRIYDKYYPRQCAIAISEHKRTNPTLPLRLAHLEKYAIPNAFSVSDAALEASVDSIINDVISCPEHVLLPSEMECIVQSGLTSIQIDQSSAAGYPYKSGVKKRDVRRDAERSASAMLSDDILFDSYIADHVWYSTGRARMQKIDDDDAARIIIYAGYAYLLMAMVLLQPWSRFMNRHFDWCGVGFSWMQCGANKFAEFMMADKGFAPVGFRYVSLDISGWDTKLHPRLLLSLRAFYVKLLRKLRIPAAYQRRFLAVFDNMVSCPVVMPLGYLFRISQGMKSGWAATANDNTLIHEIVFRVIQQDVGDIKHILYGDDNFMLVPDSVSNDMIVSQYARFGLRIKHIHSSICLGDVDFLSKHVKYWNGNYYVFRESVESHSRMLMPEEMDPRRRDRPDAVIAVERVLGHLLDNPFNEDVRKVCYDILERLRGDYHVEYIDVHDDMLKKHPWRMFDTSRIPRRFPTVPSMLFIESLYGVPFPCSALMSWPQTVSPIGCDPDASANDAFMYDAASTFCNDVACRANDVLMKNVKHLVRKLSPFTQPKHCYGFHAARFEFAVKYFAIKFNNVLDLGSHPGACAASAMKYCGKVVCVSKKPSVDTRDFCPYVVRCKDVTTIRTDADHFVPHTPFDLQHDDVDIVGPRTEEDDIKVGLGMIRRARMNSGMVMQALFTLKEVNWKVVEDLYSLYVDFGHIDFVKPLFSNPWKSEFMVYVKKSKGPRMRKARFKAMLYAFLNSMAKDMFVWGEIMASAVSSYEGISSIVKNPHQSSEHESEWIKEF